MPIQNTFIRFRYLLSSLMVVVSISLSTGIPIRPRINFHVRDVSSISSGSYLIRDDRVENSIVNYFKILVPSTTLSQPDPKIIKGLNPEVRFQAWELVTSMAWSPDGKILAVAAGNQIYLFQSETLEIIDRVEIGALSSGLGFSLDGQIFASSSRDGILRVWSLDPVSQGKNSLLLKPKWQVNAHRKGANTLAFSPNGEIIATGGNDAMVRVWEVKSGKKLSEVIGGTYSVPSLKFSLDSRTLAIVNGNFVRLRDVETGRIVGSFRVQESLYCVDFDPAGSYLAVGSSENQLYLWKIDEAFRTGSDNYPLPVVLATHQGHPGGVSALVWQIRYSPDGKFLISAGGDGMIKVVDARDYKQVMEIDAHYLAVTSLAFSPDSQQFASGGLDGIVRIWSLDQLR